MGVERKGFGGQGRTWLVCLAALTVVALGVAGGVGDRWGEGASGEAAEYRRLAAEVAALGGVVAALDLERRAERAEGHERRARASAFKKRVVALAALAAFVAFVGMMVASGVWERVAWFCYGAAVVTLAPAVGGLVSGGDGGVVRVAAGAGLEPCVRAEVGAVERSEGITHAELELGMPRPLEDCGCGSRLLEYRSYVVDGGRRERTLTGVLVGGYGTVTLPLVADAALVEGEPWYSVELACAAPAGRRERGVAWGK